MNYKDPVCGMDVENTSPYHLEKEGEKIYFCSENCKNKFEQNNLSTDDNQELNDPVCGMKVTSDSHFQSIRDNHTYYFCSAGCKVKFDNKS